MLLHTSVTNFNPGSTAFLFLGPFPPGTLIRGFYVNCTNSGAGTGNCDIAARWFVTQPQGTVNTAIFAGGFSLFRSVLAGVVEEPPVWRLHTNGLTYGTQWYFPVNHVVDIYPVIGFSVIPFTSPHTVGFGLDATPPGGFWSQSSQPLRTRSLDGLDGRKHRRMRYDKRHRRV